MPAFREITNGLRFPEGPIALADGSVVLVEIQGGALTRVTPDGEKRVIAQLGGGPNGAALGPDGKFYVCNNGGFAWHRDEHGLRPVRQADDYDGGRIERVDLQTGEVEVLYREVEGRGLRGPNDIVFDRQGGFWFTDLGKVRPRDQDRGGVYYAKADGSKIIEVIHPMVHPNGIGLSPEEDRLYVVESVTGRLWAFEITGPGEIRREAWPSPNGGRLVAGLAGYQLFDSLAVEAGGNICVATLARGAITVISPEGDIVDQVEFPDRYVTNICFGGAAMCTAFITLSQSGRLVAMDWARPGLRLNFQK